MEEKNLYLIKDDDREETILVNLTKEQASAIKNFLDWAEIDDCSIEKVGGTVTW